MQCHVEVPDLNLNELTQAQEEIQACYCYVVLRLIYLALWLVNYPAPKSVLMHLYCF